MKKLFSIMLALALALGLCAVSAEAVPFAGGAGTQDDPYQIATAEQLLGRPYAIAGVVSHGAGIASDQLHTPTANLADERLQLPPYGVYAARTALGEGAELPGIVYIGDAPTIRGRGNGHPIVELHLFDFKGNRLAGRIDTQTAPVVFDEPSAGLQRVWQRESASCRRHFRKCLVFRKIWILAEQNPQTRLDFSACCLQRR